MNLDDGAVRAALEARLATATGADAVGIASHEKLSGGAIQFNIALDVQVHGGSDAGRHRWVLRTDAPTVVASSRTREDEYKLLRAAHAAGVKVPRPLGVWHANGSDKAWFVMERVAGTAAAHRLTKPGALPDGPALARELGGNLARIHSIRPPRDDLGFLGAAPMSPTRDWLDHARAYLDHWRATQHGTYPALEWGLRWLYARASPPEPVVLLHRDYRTGNYMVDQGRLTGVLDWEFAGWGHPLEDIGWFCARCWRFAQPDQVAGGIAPASDFLAGYNAVAGTAYTEGDTLRWQALAHLRWAVIALQQAERFLSSGERSLELALTGRMLPELELELLRLTPA